MSNLDAALSHLGSLMERAPCPLDERPSSFDVNLLRVLDSHGYIEARILERDSSVPPSGPPQGRIGTVCRWYSPIQDEYVVGGEWPELLALHAKEPELWVEIRVTPLGKAKLAEREVENRARSTGKGADGSDRPPIERQDHAMAILFREPAISPTELAERVGVSKGTLYSQSAKWRSVRMTLLARDRDRIPRGTKSADGDIEAESEADIS